MAEKLSTLRTEEYFAERAARGDLKRALSVLKRAGVGQPPLPGDESTSSSSTARRRTVKATDASDVDKILRFAIANKRLIQVSYTGSVRVLEPHDYGIQNGKTRLLGYQRRVSGNGQRTGIKGWRMLDVSKIGQCVVLGEFFQGSRGASHQRHYVWEVVYARVDGGD